MKTCSRCKKSKDSEKDFSKKLGGRQPYCRACQSEWQKTYYKINQKAQIARCNKRRSEQVKSNREKTIAYLLEHPCVDCGETDIVVLQFDHVRGKKKGELCKMILTGYAWETIRQEIDKCDVRCSNDHLRRTAAQQKNYKVLWVAGVSGNIPPS